MSAEPAGTTHLFVYGTLRPGDVRWHFLEPFVADDGRDDTVAGDVYDTGCGYPAAIFATTGMIHGRAYELAQAAQQRCLEVLDEVEGVVDGGYRRVEVTTSAGVRCWAYEYGSGLELTLIESGDWLRR